MWFPPTEKLHCSSIFMACALSIVLETMGEFAFSSDMWLNIEVFSVNYDRLKLMLKNFFLSFLCVFWAVWKCIVPILKEILILALALLKLTKLRFFHPDVFSNLICLMPLSLVHFCAALRASTDPRLRQRLAFIPFLLTLWCWCFLGLAWKFLGTCSFQSLTLHLLARHLACL